MLEISGQEIRHTVVIFTGKWWLNDLAKKVVCSYIGLGLVVGRVHNLKPKALFGATFTFIFLLS